MSMGKSGRMYKARAHGEIEYLVLLAVVLIISLVTIAVLMFSSKTSSDTQAVESRIYWQSASPIAVTEAVAYRSATPYSSTISLILRNNGAYPIKITSLLSGSDWVENITIGGATAQLSDRLYLAPGEKKKIDHTLEGVQPYSAVNANFSNGSSITSRLGSVSSLCDHSLYMRTAKTVGTLTVRDFGFEYMEYIEGVSTVKKQLGEKPLSVKCFGD